MGKKTLLLVVLNLAAAAAIGLMAGLSIKYGAKEGNDAGSQLRERIAELSSGLDADIGVAAILPDGDTVLFDRDRSGCESSGGRRYPLMSVMKFHQALAVCGWLRDSGISLDTKVDVGPEQLPEGTWSPMRDKSPLGGSYSYRELMEYTLVYSDNNACDILFGLSGGPGRTADFIREYGVGDFDIACTEAMMHEDLSNCARNWSTPLSAASLADRFHSDRNEDEYSRFIWDTMKGCTTGLGRIPGKISGKVAEIAHKTGTGDIGPDGRISAVNDVGTVVLEDGRHFSLSVMVCNAAGTMEECEALIADIAEAVFLACGNHSRD